MAEVLACTVVILDGTTISQDVNVSSVTLYILSLSNRVASGHNYHCANLFPFAEESRRPGAA